MPGAASARSPLMLGYAIPRPHDSWQTLGLGSRSPMHCTAAGADRRRLHPATVAESAAKLAAKAGRFRLEVPRARGGFLLEAGNHLTSHARFSKFAAMPSPVLSC